MHINATTCYAIQLLSELATQKRQMSRTELSERTGIKHHFCQNILLRLKRAGIVESSRGIDGGFRLAEAPYEITLLDVVLKLEGLTLLSAFEDGSPDGVPKGVYWELFAVQRDIERRLDEITIGHLSEIAGTLLEATDKAAVTDQKPWRAHRPTWASVEIAKAARNGWINGYPDGTFKPDQKISRAEAMALVNRVLNRDPASPEDLLSDMIQWPDNMDTDKWYYLDIQEATNSHTYDRTTKITEKWLAIEQPRKWAALEGSGHSNRN